MRLAATRAGAEERGASLFPVLAYNASDRLFLLDDKTLAFGFVANPLMFADQGVVDKVNAMLQQDFPKDSFLQIIFWNSPDAHVILDAFLELREAHRAGAAALPYAAALRQADFLRDHIHEPIESRNRTHVRNAYSMICAKIPFHGTTPTEKEITRAHELATAIAQSIETIGNVAVPIAAGGYIRIMGTLLNWQSDAAWVTDRTHYDTDQLIREQLLDYPTGVFPRYNGVWLGDDPDASPREGRWVKTLSVKRFPDLMSLAGTLSYLGDILTGSRGIRESFMITMNVYFPDAESLKEKMELKRQATNYQSLGPMVKFVPRLLSHKNSHDVLFEAVEQGDRLVKAALTFLLFAKDEDHAVSAVSNMRTYYRELGFQVLEDKFFALPLFLNALPFGCEKAAVRDLNRYRTFATRHVTQLLPLLGDWKGTPTPVMQFVSRNGQLTSFDLFDASTNYNALIMAESGSGKSVLTNAMVNAYRSLGAQIYIIDVGRSYKKMCSALGGRFVEFAEGSDICLNPFSIVGDYDDEADILVGILTAMAFPKENITDLQAAELRRVLKEQWEAHGRGLTVDKVAQALIATADKRIQDVGRQLFPFTAGGEYGKFFHGENNMQLQNALAVLELEELKSKKHLQAVVLLQLIYQIQQAIYPASVDRSVKKVIIIDEAWDLLKNSSDVSSFMETAFRRFRKYNAAAVLVTQSLNDLYDNPNGIPIIENSANMLFLGQKPETIESLRAKKRLSLSDGGFNILKTVHTIPGVYSEIFFYTKHGAGIGRLLLDRFTQLLYTTKGDEVAAIDRLTESGLSVEDAIQRLVVQEQARASR